MKVLITGVAGFIGFSVANKLLNDYDTTIVGVDNYDSYYDIRLKKARTKVLESSNRFIFRELDINDKALIDLFDEFLPDIVIHLAAQAGVRYSLENPKKYVETNINGFLNILEACRKYPVKHLLYASSSSVYGGNTIVPFSTEHNVDHPVSLYAATKKANELMAHTYSQLFDIPTTGLRFFTVYGPWGRPDMAYFGFTKSILEGTPIKVFNHGELERDFTYIDDIVDAVVRLINHIPKRDLNWNQNTSTISSSFAPYKIYNIGNNKPIKLMDFIRTLESVIGKNANIEFSGMQPGDVYQTFADISEIKRDVDFSPRTNLKDGLTMFVEWYKQIYNKEL